MKLLSVIVSVYNVEEYIINCLESIFNQTYNNFEVIIVDDCSSDKTLAIIKNTFSSNKNMRIIENKENHGLGFTRNVGVKEANADFICFIDSDDIVEKNYLSSMMKLMETEKADMIICDFNKIDENNKIIETNIKKIKKTEKVDIDHCIRYDSTPTWNKLYKKELFNNIFYQDNLKSQDLGTTPKIFLKCNNIFYINEALINYRVRKNSITTNYNDKLDDIYLILEDIYNYYIKHSRKKLFLIEFLFYKHLRHQRIRIMNVNNLFVRFKYSMKTNKFLKSYFPKYKNNIEIKKYIKNNNSFIDKIINDKILNKFIFIIKRRIKK